MKSERLIINENEINFIHQGQGSPFLILHGWGGSSLSWERVISILKEKFSVFCLDFPGFGKSPPPNKVLSLEDFAFLVNNFVEKVGIDNFYLLGHSFGGRVAIKYTILFPQKIKSLILVSPAGLFYKKSPFKRSVVFCSKIGKRLFSRGFLRNLREKLENYFYFFFASKDYFKAKGIMREIMKKVIEEDLSSYLPRIKTKTLILWGKEDKILPVSLAKEFNSKIQNSKLLILEKVGHSPHLEVPEILSKILIEFAQND